MAAPTMTFNTAGNGLASSSLAASGTSSFNIDLSTKFEGQLEYECTFGTIAATAGLQATIFAGYGATPTYPTTNPNFTYVLPAVAGLQKSPKIFLPTGKWRITLTNLDATNGLTTVAATYDTVDTIV
jgi:hypothetical protein